jgi:2'-5' RNA ligase
MSQPLVVIAYPALSQDDYARIQGVRAAHDELYFKLVDPHITLVFPTTALGERELVAHVRESTAGTRKIDFTLRCAVVWDDATQPYWHVFLVPEEGFSAVVNVHDVLYRGALASELRLEVPFIPHMGVATSRDAHACKTVADLLNADGIAIAGRIESLAIAALEADRVRTIETIELG